MDGGDDVDRRIRGFGGQEIAFRFRYHEDGVGYPGEP